jgi:thioredoxin reductase (NADPH)
MDQRFDVMIIGGGPAGFTAAVYTSRAKLSSAIIEFDAPGGKLVKTATIENWPGVVSTTGVDLAIQMYNHATSFGAQYLYGKVVEVLHHEDYQEIICEDGQRYEAKAVIIASGTIERKMQIPGEMAMLGKGVSFCAVCDGAFFTNKDVVVIGGGNSALEEAVYLTQFVNSVTIVIRRDVFRADPIAIEHALKQPKIKVIYQHLPQEVVIENNRVVGLKISSVKDQTTQVIACEGIFPYLGADPASGFVKNLKITDEFGYLIVDDQMQTKIPGIYGAGDVCVKHLRQVVTAANDGAVAAVAVSHYLKGA